MFCVFKHFLMHQLVWYCLKNKLKLQNTQNSFLKSFKVHIFSYHPLIIYRNKMKHPGQWTSICTCTRSLNPSNPILSKVSIKLFCDDNCIWLQYCFLTLLTRILGQKILVNSICIGEIICQKIQQIPTMIQLVVQYVRGVLQEVTCCS